MLLKLYKTVTVFQKLERLLGKKYFRRLNYGFHGGSDGKASACNADHLEKEMATHSIALAINILVFNMLPLLYNLAPHKK